MLLIDDLPFISLCQSPMFQDLDQYPPPVGATTPKHEGGEVVVETSSPKRGKKKRDNSTLRKAPQAPKRFKSSYICFFMAKQPEIKEELGKSATVTEISKRSAEMWYVSSQAWRIANRSCFVTSGRLS